ncbi:hypothetical protein AVEN_80010-1 [Araneus ventricosus]|uniref:Uncharacterized protein n=1 Tax=Araneus ventricosus TaxID=182803 RepID=A0A4Y2FLZ0_ARAVE|nr:hypothetical protein AVEN_80010-1 [Araneus ventricosus]
MTNHLCQIEACINSRPLPPLSSDPSDISALTPSQFLIESSLLDLPDLTHSQPKLPLSIRWHTIQDKYSLAHLHQRILASSTATSKMGFTEKRPPS